MKQILVTVLYVVSVVLLAATFFIVGIYQLGWNNELVDGFLRLVPLPAATVNREFISIRQVQTLLRMNEKLTGSQTAAKPILDRLIENAMIEDLARKLGLSASPDGADHYFQYLLRSFGVEAENAGQELERLFGVSEEDFKRLIVLPDLRKVKLEIYLLERDQDSADYMQVEVVKNALSSGMDFVEATAVYSEDPASRFIGGDLGFLSREELPPWIGAAVPDLEIGKVSDIVTSPEGYHIFEVTARDENGEQEKIQLRQIFIKSSFDFDEYLAKQRVNYRIFVFKKI